MGVLSVVLPAYNEEAMVRMAADTLAACLEKEEIPYELIFVDDGSRDHTWESIVEAQAKNERIHGVHFSRNFGKEAAIFAGLGAATGDCTAVMDCDLQHPPSTLVEMYRLWEQGFQVIEGIKHSRGEEGLFHKLAAKGFYMLMSKAVGFDMSRASDFKLLDRVALEALLALPAS